MIDRELEGTIREYISKREIIAIVGPRQSGKTTLLQKIYTGLRGAEFITLEDQEALDLFENDIDSFIELYVKGNKYLFIDEVQYAKNGGKRLKYIYDTQDIKLFISGSSAPGLSIHSIKYLVGRIFIFHLYPCSFREFVRFKEPRLAGLLDSSSPQVIKRILRLYKEFAVFGGYPRVVTSETNEERMLVLKNIYNTYLLREIKEILALPSDFKLTKLAKALALQIGGLVNYSELCEVSSLSYHDLIRYMDILEKTFVCKRVLPFFTNRRTEITKTPKIFFYDNGFRNAIIGQFSDFDARSDAGMLNENFVASEILKMGHPLNYWRTKSKAEVDFVVDGTPIEVKSKLSSKKTTRSLQSFLEKYSPKVAFIGSYDLKSLKKIGKTTIAYEPLYNIAYILK